MDKRMIYLISLIAELSQKIDIPKVYSNKFKASGNNYLSPTEKIRIEDLTNHFVTAGIVGRSEVLPIIGRDGYVITEFEPDVIGAQSPYSASDLTLLQAGIPMFTATGTEIPTIKQLENKYGRILAAAIGNRFEKQCAEVYLKGTYTDKDGKILNVGVIKNTDITFTANTIYSDEILKLMLSYQKKFGFFPTVEVGETIFNALKNEANNTRQNINGVKFVFGEVPYLEIGQKKIEILCDGKDTKDNVIDTKNLIILSTPRNLAVGYGCLTYGDIKANESRLVRAEIAAGDTAVEATSGSKGLWAKSAPMPILLTTEKFKRYKVKITA
ncbi:hypothetical protein [Fusobacterium ulcerans]|uniref:major capsid protein n=1 Tax=Fusobacterium ulcerans TaxID=861 RepID=UPI00241D8E1C|nr:hypothetical protein [Fusobacterium ulcerans]